MTDHLWRLDESDGDLCVRTGVEGKAASMGHRPDPKALVAVFLNGHRAS